MIHQHHQFVARVVFERLLNRVVERDTGNAAGPGEELDEGGAIGPLGRRLVLFRLNGVVILLTVARVKQRLQTEFAIPSTKIAIIPHGPFFYDLPASDTTAAHQQLGLPSGHNFALWQGIIFPYKGIDLLLDAWYAVERSVPDALLIIAGTGAPAFLDAIRDTERRIQIAEKQTDKEVPSMERPSGTPASFDDYAKLMINLQVLAYQTDLTRVVTFAMEHEGGGRAYPEIGIPDDHHALSHHQNNPANIAKLVKIHRYHMGLFAYYLERLQSVREGDGNLLDKAVIMYGSALSDGNSHLHENLPVILVGGGGGRLTGNRHVRVPDLTPMTNLHLAVLDKLGVPIEKLGDSTGKLDLSA